MKGNKQLQEKLVFWEPARGGWIASIAANKRTASDLVILNVEPAVSVFQQDIHRVQNSMKSDGWPDASIDSALAYTSLYFKYATGKNQKVWNSLQNLVGSLKSEKWARLSEFS